MQTITVHKANESDAKSLAQMAQALAAFEGEESFADERSMRRLLAGEGEPRCHCLLAKQAGKAIGFVYYYAGYDLASASEGFHLADLFVHEQYRGQSVATQLLVEVAEHAKAQGREWVSLTASRGNQDALAFYQAKGFSDVPIRFFALGKQGMKKLRGE